MPRVSVIVPVYNQPVLLVEAIESLRSQSMPDWECILVDDGSTDQTPDTLRRLASEDARVILEFQDQKGAAAARNRGAAKARADWLLFLDSDDWLAPDALGTLLDAAEPGTDMVHGLGLRVCGSARQDISQVRLPGGDLFARLATTATFMIHACILRKTVFEAVGGFDQGLRGCADWDLWQRVVRSGAQCVGVDRVVAFYRHTAHSLSTKYGQEFHDGLIVIARGHARDPRVPSPDPRYADGAPQSGFATAAYRFGTWLAGVAMARGHSRHDILIEMARLPPADLHPEEIASSLFDAIPIGLGDFRPDWAAVWPGLRPTLTMFLADLARLAGCGPSFPQTVLSLLEEMAATGNATQRLSAVGRVASVVVPIPGHVPPMSPAQGIETLVVVGRAGGATLAPVSIPVDPGFSAEIVRRALIDRHAPAIFRAYWRKDPWTMLAGLSGQLLGSAPELAEVLRRRPFRLSARLYLCAILRRQTFVLPIQGEKP